MNILAKVDPTSRFLALAVLTVPLLFSIDVVSASVAIAGTVAGTWVCGSNPWRLLRIAWPLLLIAPVSGVGMALYGREGGAILWQWGPIVVSENSLLLAIGVTARVLAVGLPAVVLMRGIDTTRLGDGLAQLWKLPERFVVGTVAGLRTAGLFQRDWGSLERARRARGLGDKPVLARLPQQYFALLVLALRRASKLSTAMEARGFGAQGKRTWGRVAQVGRWDVVLVGACACLAIAALGLAVWTGHFRFLGVT